MSDEEFDIRDKDYNYIGSITRSTSSGGGDGCMNFLVGVVLWGLLGSCAIWFLVDLVRGRVHFPNSTVIPSEQANPASEGHGEFRVHPGDPEILFDMKENEWSPWFVCEASPVYHVVCRTPGWAVCQDGVEAGPLIPIVYVGPSNKGVKYGGIARREKFRFRGAPGPAGLYLEQ